MTSSIAQRVISIRRRIEEAASACGRSGSEITLMAVTKNRTVEQIKDIISCGVTLLGENRVQELAEKVPRLPKEAHIHMIGHLQSNKVQGAVEHSICIQSVDREKILRAIDRHAGRAGVIRDVMIEVNTSGEENKHGVGSFNEADELAVIARCLEHVRLTGLMTMGPLTDDKHRIRKSFASLRGIRDQLQSGSCKGVPLILSMGMSQDFEIAVQEGTDMVRIGSSLFEG